MLDRRIEHNGPLAQLAIVWRIATQLKILLHRRFFSVSQVSGSPPVNPTAHPSNGSRKFLIWIDSTHDLLQTSMPSRSIVLDEGSAARVRHDHVALRLAHESYV